MRCESAKLTFLALFLAGRAEGICRVDDDRARWLAWVLRAVGVCGDGEGRVAVRSEDETPAGMTSCGTEGLLAAVGTARDSLGRATERTACIVIVIECEGVYVFDG